MADYAPAAGRGEKVDRELDLLGAIYLGLGVMGFLALSLFGRPESPFIFGIFPALLVGGGLFALFDRDAPSTPGKPALPQHLRFAVVFLAVALVTMRLLPDYAWMPVSLFVAVVAGEPTRRRLVESAVVGVLLVGYNLWRG
jgi:hypothetical protein